MGIWARRIIIGSRFGGLGSGLCLLCGGGMSGSSYISIYRIRLLFFYAGNIYLFAFFNKEGKGVKGYEDFVFYFIIGDSEY